MSESTEVQVTDIQEEQYPIFPNITPDKIDVYLDARSEGDDSSLTTDSPLNTLIISLEESIAASKQKNESKWGKLFRECKYSEGQVTIRQELLATLRQLIDQEDSSDTLNSIFVALETAVKQSSVLLQNQPIKVLKNLELKKHTIDIQRCTMTFKFDFDASKPCDIGHAVGTDQHWKLVDMLLAYSIPNINSVSSLSNTNEESIKIEAIDQTYDVSSLLEDLQIGIENSQWKDSSQGMFRQTHYSQLHTQIRQRLAQEVRNIECELPYMNEQIVSNNAIHQLRSAFATAIDESTKLLRNQCFQVLAKIELKNEAREKIKFSDIVIADIGKTIGNDQHFVLCDKLAEIKNLSDNVNLYKTPAENTSDTICSIQ